MLDYKYLQILHMEDNFTAISFSHFEKEELVYVCGNLFLCLCKFHTENQRKIFYNMGKCILDICILRGSQSVGCTP